MTVSDRHYNFYLVHNMETEKGAANIGWTFDYIPYYLTQAQFDGFFQSVTQCRINRVDQVDQPKIQHPPLNNYIQPQQQSINGSSK